MNPVTDEQGSNEALAHSLWERLSQRIGTDSAGGVAPSNWRWSEPEWEEAAPGITFKILANDEAQDRVTMLVRLEGELWIEDRKLVPGDYNRREPGTSDDRVWSETGCMCVLITSPSDVLR